MSNRNINPDDYSNSSYFSKLTFSSKIKVNFVTTFQNEFGQLKTFDYKNIAVKCNQLGDLLVIDFAIDSIGKQVKAFGTLYKKDDQSIYFDGTSDFLGNIQFMLGFFNPDQSYQVTYFNNFTANGVVIFNSETSNTVSVGVGNCEKVCTPDGTKCCNYKDGELDPCGTECVCYNEKNECVKPN